MSLLRDVAEADGKVVILSHLNADPDAIGSSIAVHEFLKSRGINSKISVAGSVNALARNLLKKLKYKVEINPDLKGVDTVLILDTSSVSQLSPVNLSVFEGRLFIIDHHFPDPDLKSRAYKAIFDESAPSASELVYKQLVQEGFKFTKKVCIALIAGIVTDTAHLQFARPETFRILSDLLDHASLDYSDVLHLISIPTEPSRKIAHLKSASRLQLEKIDDWIVALSHVSSFEASAARALVKIGADVAFVCSKNKEEARVSVRANTPFVKKTGINFAKDYAPELVKALEGSGGGHTAAISVEGVFDGNESELLRLCFNILEALFQRKKMGRRAQ